MHGSIGGRWPEDPNPGVGKTRKPRPSVSTIGWTSNQRPTLLWSPKKGVHDVAVGGLGARCGRVIWSVSSAQINATDSVKGLAALAALGGPLWPRLLC
jgi:hypothetical protein